ncbi:MAG: hypothetical protein AAFO94_17970, partial [Bacteroidota bacterium]
QSHKEGRVSFYELAQPILRIAVELNQGRAEPLRQFLDFSQLFFQSVGTGAAFQFDRRPTAYNAVKRNRDTTQREKQRTSMTAIIEAQGKIRPAQVQALSNDSDVVPAALAFSLMFHLAKASEFEKWLRQYPLSKWAGLAEKDASSLFIEGVMLCLEGLKRQPVVEAAEKLDLLQRRFSNEAAFVLALSFLSAGVRYFQEDDQRALYQLSLEERSIFRQFV